MAATAAFDSQSNKSSTIFAVAEPTLFDGDKSAPTNVDRTTLGTAVDGKGSVEALSLDGLSQQKAAGQTDQYMMDHGPETKFVVIFRSYI